MHKVYVRELKPYSLAALSSLFGYSFSQAKILVGDLMTHGIVRYRTGTKSIPEEDDAEDAAPDELYQFRFVGLVVWGDALIVAYPKYFRDRVPTDDELRLILRLLKRDAGVAAVANIEDGGTATDNKLPVMLALLDLYGEHGEYSNYIEGREFNGNGVIDWNRTIDSHLPIIQEGQPIYTEFEARKAFRNDSDYITRLHRAVLTACSREFREAGIDKLLALDELCLSDEKVEDFGDTETLSYRLEHERAIQFIDWKLLTIDLLERFLLAHESEVHRDEMQALGTTAFYKVWEDACKAAFGDALNKRLDDLGFTIEGNWSADSQKKLIEIIPRPQWERWLGDNFGKREDTDTLIPDTITIAEGQGGERVLCIYDAKHYVPSTSGKMKHQPGVESVAKQFLYQSAYREFIKEHKFDRVANAFLVPGTVDTSKLIARVSFPGVITKEKKPFDNFIYMWMLPAHDVFKAYLDGEMLCSEIIQIASMVINCSTLKDHEALHKSA